jgi:acyl-CoA synthetase (NDP forming)
MIPGFTMSGNTLSEHASKALLAGFGVPVARETLADTADEAARAAESLGFPVVAKLCGDAIAHKTERRLVRLGLADTGAVRAAAAELLALRRAEDGAVQVLVAEQVRGHRELIAGLVRDPTFGPCVLVGLGGIMTEALGDVAFAAAPLVRSDARRMVEGLAARRALLEPFRGEPALDLDALAAILTGLGRLGLERPDVASVDLNPLIVRDGKPVAVDALVVLGAQVPRAASRPLPAPEALRERFRPLFNPRGVIVAGASSHPGKFGFAALHNLLRFGFRGEIFPVNREGGEILGRRTYRDVGDVPLGQADLAFICTPPAANIGILRACARAGVRAAFVASGGYGEADDEGRAREQELVRTAEELGITLAGPNGQGVISTAASMCAQIVAPYPPPGRISVASQSGNVLSAFLNYATLTGIGATKAVSTGNAAQTTLADYLAYFAADPDTAVALAYLEGVPDGAAFVEALRRLTSAKPAVVLKGGVAAAGQRAAASHTGSLASDVRVFAGICRQLGVVRAPTVEHAFEWAATFATQPLPRGRRIVVVTTAGGLGVLTADALVAAELDLIALPASLRARIDSMVPARWSRQNPIDMAGGETRDTIPEALDLVCAHPDVDAVLLLGIGIQSNQANAFRSGPFFPGHGLERICEFHERQDRRYAEAAQAASERHGKPVLVATELTYADRAYGNAGPMAVREGGRLCYPSAHRAVAALAAMVEYAEFRGWR